MPTVPPYADPRSFDSTGYGSLRIGRVADGSISAGGVTGVPTGCILVQGTLNSPAAAVTNRFLSAQATTTSAKSYTLLTNSMPDTFVQDGVTYYVARGISAFLSGSATAALLLTGTDPQGVAQTETLNFTASAGPVYSQKMWRTLTAASTTSDTNVNLSIGFDNEFSTLYPFYSNQGVGGVLVDADGADYPNTPLTPDGVNYSITGLELSQWKNANGTTVVGAASTSNLGLVTGTIGTATPSLQTTDLKNTSAAPTARFIQARLPANYIPGSAITIRVNAGMLTTVASNSAATTIDFSAYKNGSGSDLVTTAATSANFLTAANYDFVVTPTGLVAGDWLDILMTFTVTDVGTGTAVIGKVNAVSVLATAIASTVSPYATFTAGDPTSTTADKYGKVLIGQNNLSSGALVPDGTRDYAYWFICNDTQGVPNTGQGQQFIYDQT